MECEWRKFKQRLTLYLQALGWDTKPDAQKTALPQAVEVFNTFVFASEDDNEKSDKVVEKFDEHCSPKKNETFKRYVFRSHTQVQADSFDAFVTDLKLKAGTCNFGQLKDSMIRDQIVFGINDQRVRERLLRETDLTLAGAMKICHASELAQQHAKTFGECTKEDSAAAAVATVSGRTQKHKTYTKQNINKLNDTENFMCK